MIEIPKLKSNVFVFAYVFLFCAFFVSAIVSHSGDEVLVTFATNQVSAQQAFTTLWSSLNTAANNLYSSCLLERNTSWGITASQVTSNLVVPNGFSHSGGQVTLFLAGENTNAQSALNDIFSSVNALQTGYTQYTCHPYCKGQILVSAGTCDGLGSCGANYDTGVGTDCGTQGCSETRASNGEIYTAQCNDGTIPPQPPIITPPTPPPSATINCHWDGTGVTDLYLYADCSPNALPGLIWPSGDRCSQISQNRDTASSVWCNSQHQYTETFACNCSQVNTGAPSAPTSTPSTPSSNQGSTCTSAQNSCGMTGTGTIKADGSCSAIVPPEIACHNNRY